MTTHPKPAFQIFTDKEIHLPPSFHEACLIRIAESLLDDYGYAGKVVLVLTDDATIHDLNRRYRGINRSTDVLSFDLSDGDEMTGEIYIALPTAERQATTLGIPVAEEVYRLSVHGLLHLTGWNDQTEEEEAAMARETERYLNHIIDLVKEGDSRRG